MPDDMTNERAREVLEDMQRIASHNVDARPHNQRVKDDYQALTLALAAMDENERLRRERDEAVRLVRRGLRTVYEYGMPGVHADCVAFLDRIDRAALTPDPKEARDG